MILSKSSEILLNIAIFYMILIPRKIMNSKIFLLDIYKTGGSLKFPLQLYFRNHSAATPPSDSKIIPYPWVGSWVGSKHYFRVGWVVEWC